MTSKRILTEPFLGYTFQQEQEFKEARAREESKQKSKATHFLEYDARLREYKPLPIPQYARD